jgi:uncharacterized membrane protein
MSIGPIEMLVVKFPGNEFRGEIVPALEELIDNGTIRIVDLVFILKEADGSVDALEYSDLGGEINDLLSPVAHEMSGLLNEDDVAEIGQLLEPNSSAALMLFENVWATRFRDAVLNAKGELLLSERIPHSAVQEVLNNMQAEAY